MESSENNKSTTSLSKYWQVFKRVVKHYSLEERVFSIIGIALVIFFSIQWSVEIAGNTSLNETTGYTEGIVSTQPILLNPVYIDFSDPNRDISSLIFSGLTRYNPVTKTFVEDLASFSINETQTIYRFTLRDNIVWHDGTPVTADDVFFTYHDVIQNPEFQNPIIKTNFEGVLIRKIDEKTVEFELGKPNSFFITNCNVGILPKHILGETPVQELPLSEFNRNPIGTGPYKVQSPLEMLEDGRQRITLTAFEEYSHPIAQITTIRFHIYPDGESLLKEQSTLNIINKVPREVISELEKNPRFSFTTYELPQYTAVFINNDNIIFKKLKVRIALQKAIDKQKLLELLPYKKPVDTPLMDLNQTDWLYKPNIEEAKGALFDSGYKMPATTTNPTTTTPPSSTTPPTSSATASNSQNPTANISQNSNPTPPTTNPSNQTNSNPTNEAQPPSSTTATTEVAEENLYRKGPDGKILTLNVAVRSYEEGSVLAEEMKILTDFLINSWKEAGIKINLNELPADLFNEAIQNRSYDLIIAGETLGYNLDTYPYWHSSQADGSGLNLSNYRSFIADTAIEKIRATVDPQEKQKQLQTLAKTISEDVPAIFLYRPSYVFASDNKVKNIFLQNLAYPSDRFTTVEQWCIKC